MDRRVLLTAGLLFLAIYIPNVFCQEIESTYKFTLFEPVSKVFSRVESKMDNSQLVESKDIVLVKEISGKLLYEEFKDNNGQGKNELAKIISELTLQKTDEVKYDVKIKMELRFPDTTPGVSDSVSYHGKFESLSPENVRKMIDTMKNEKGSMDKFVDKVANSFKESVFKKGLEKNTMYGDPTFIESLSRAIRNFTQISFQKFPEDIQRMIKIYPDAQ